jgi:methyl-accepting chemotaxis protein
MSQKLQNVVELLLNDVHQGMESEIASIKNQTQQIQTLLIDAIASLHSAFESIDHQSAEQMKLFSALVSELAGENGSQENLFQHTEEAGKSLTELLKILIHDSRKSLSSLTDMNETVVKIQDAVSDAQKTSALLKQVNLLASEEKPDIEKIRQLSFSAMDLHTAMLGKAEGIQASCIHARKTINEVSSSDMDKVFASKARVEEILGHLNQSNDLISGCRTQANSVNAGLRQHLGSAIRALQFEDIVSQSLGHTDLHLDRMEGFVSRLANGISELHKKQDVSLDEYADQIGLLHQEIMAYRNGLRLEETNPISQTNMDEGEVELF